jgi:outer membrane protein assembly factor BamB
MKGRRGMPALIVCTICVLVVPLFVPVAAPSSQGQQSDVLRWLLTPGGNKVLPSIEKYYQANDYPSDGNDRSAQSTCLIPGQESQSGGPMNSSWPMYCHDVKHTSRSPYSTASNPYVEKWRFRTISGLWIQTSPTISSDGTIYFGDGSYLNALYANGTMKWANRLNSETLGSTPAIDENGTIYIGTWDYIFHAIYPNGTTKWRFNAQGIIADSPAIAKDGTIYFGNTRGRIWAINPNHSPKWYYDTGDALFSSPAIGEDGAVYIGSCDHYVYAMNSNGTLRWRFQTGGEIHGHPSIALDGTIYITSYDGYLYALSPNGTQRWKIAVGWGSQSDSAIASDGTIYVGGDHLYAIYPNGTMRWIFDLGTERWIGLCSPALSADGTIYVGAIIGDGHGGEIIGVNPDGSEHWRKYIADDEIENSLAIASDGTIYVAADNLASGQLKAFGRGPLLVDANGPYVAFYQQPIQFTGTVYGGIPPYSYHWDFGDGNTSVVQNPTHTYSSIGNYTATLTVTDTEGNSSNDTARVTINYKPPTVTISKPVNGLYIKDTRILPIRKCIIIGQITIEANAYQDPLGIARVEFSIDGKLKATDTEAPYSWTWSALSFSKHTITVTAFDTSGKSVQASITVSKFF